VPVSVTILPVLVKADSIVANDVERENLNAAENFETYRSYLFSIAYRMLGSVMDAEDMVQETFLRYQSASYETINSLKAYLTTIMTRLCIDQLHLAYKQREIYLGPWLPEPINTANMHTPNAEEATVMKESLSVAFLSMLEQLQPVERAVFLLREVFDYDYADIATIVGRKEAACRQLFSRAKKHLVEDQHRSVVPPEVHKQLLESFLQAVQVGDQTALMELLTEDVQLVADGGGKIPGAATQHVVGSHAVAQFAIGVNLRFLPAVYHIEFSEVNYQPAVIVRADGRALVVMTADLEEDRMKTIRFMANPDKLAHL
jgi:RNA polymerase sigma-70 factor, ECF subfamily